MYTWLQTPITVHLGAGDPSSKIQTYSVDKHITTSYHLPEFEFQKANFTPIPENALHFRLRPRPRPRRSDLHHDPDLRRRRHLPIDAEPIRRPLPLPPAVGVHRHRLRPRPPLLLLRRIPPAPPQRRLLLRELRRDRHPVRRRVARDEADRADSDRVRVLPVADPPLLPGGSAAGLGAPRRRLGGDWGTRGGVDSGPVDH